MFGNKKKKSIRAVYAMASIDNLGFSLIGIFVPIFILSRGYGLEDIIYFFIVHNITMLSAMIASVVIGKKIGLPALLVARLPFLFLYFLALLTWETLDFSYYWLAILSGLQAALFWTPLNIIFAREAKPKELGSFVSKLQTYPQIAAIFGPLLGILLIRYFGFQSLFGAAFLVIIFSVLPTLKMRIEKVKYDLDFKKSLKFFRKHKKYMIAELFDNFGGETEGIIWPVFIFLTSMSIASVGLVGALIPIGSVAFTLFIGKRVDKGDSRFFMRIGAIALLLIWLVRFMSDSPMIYYISTLVSGFCLSLLIIPYSATMTRITKGEPIEEFIIFREIFFFVGRMILFGVALLLLGNIKMLFPLAGLAYLYFLFL